MRMSRERKVEINSIKIYVVRLFDVRIRDANVIVYHFVCVWFNLHCALRVAAVLSFHH